MPGIQSFLNARRVPLYDPTGSRTRSTRQVTHVSLTRPQGRYGIDEADMDQFWELYGAEYMDGVMGIAEMTGLYLPVLVDMDLKQELVEDHHHGILPTLYEDAFVERLVVIYQKVLADILVDFPKEDLLCILLTKNPYRIEKGGRAYTKHGFHLHFPMIYVHRYVQENELLPRIRLECKRMNYSLPVPLENALDKSYCRGNSTPWLLYGSRKDDLLDPYLIDSVFDENGRRLRDWRPMLLTYRLGVPLSPDTLDYYLPQILSTRREGRCPSYTKEPRDDLTPIRETLQNNTARSFASKNDQPVIFPDRSKTMELAIVSPPKEGTPLPSIEAEIAKDLLQILDVQRSIDFHEWMYVGWVLYNIFKGSDTGLDLWLFFSQKSPPHFDEDACRYKWSKMVQKNLTMGTLKHLAREDAPEAYQRVMNHYARPYMDKAVQLNGTHHDIALALFQKYENEFVCASVRDKLWYRFHPPVWSRNEDGVDLRARISNELVHEFEAIAKDWVSKAVQCSDNKDEARFCHKRVDQIMKLITNLKNAPFKTNIMKECTEVFYDAKFFAQLDSNPFLIAFQNGVYDLKEMQFRPGRPTDRMSLSMPIPYRNDLSMDHPDVAEVQAFLEKIFPDRSLRDYFLNISCEVFIGGNSNKIVQFWSGEGDNGKSVTQSLFEKMLGPYSIKLPTSLLVGKRTQSSSACPELARAGNGVRMAMLQEPDQKDVINIGILKELSGNDSFFARGLYKEGCEIQPMFKLVLVCNDPPKLPYNDRATWNRIRVIPFESTFTDHPPETPEEQLAQKRFPKDKYFNKKIPNMATAFAWFLLEHLRTRPSMQHEPDKVKLATSSYQQRNDVLRQFIDETIVTDDQGGALTLKTIYEHFKEWFRESVPQGKIPTRTDIREYLTRQWGDPLVGGIGGMRWEGRSIINNPSIVAPGTGTTFFDD